MRLTTKDNVPKIVLEEKQLGAHPRGIGHILKTTTMTMAFTMFVASTFHLALVSIMAIVRHDIDLINPVDFLGLTMIFPELRSSPNAIMIGWLFLAILFWVVYRFITGLEKIEAFWYGSATYGRFAKILARLPKTEAEGYTIKHLRSLYYLTRSKK